MRALIFYFSGTGNTKKVAELYAAALKAEGASVSLCELPVEPSAIKSVDVRDYDLIGIGYPIHSFNAPKIVLSLCKSLPKLAETERKIKTFIFKTSGEPVRMSDVSSLKMRALLRRRGYDAQNEYQYLMPYNIIFRHSAGMAGKMWQTAKALVPVDVAEILAGKKRLPKKLFMGNVLAWILRVEHWGAHVNGVFYRASKSKCIGCGLCERTCPVDNITLQKTEDGKTKVAFGGKCIMCVRCAFKCPTAAIDIGLFKSWKVNGEYELNAPEQNPVLTASGKHVNYCKKAYDKYFADAEKRIREFNNTDSKTP